EGLRDADRGDVVIYAQWELGPALELIWQEPEPAQPAFSRRQSLDRVAGSESASLPVKTLDLHHGLDYSVQASNLAEVDLDGEDERSWSIAFTKGFRKSLAVLDRKLQGRLLLA